MATGDKTELSRFPTPTQKDPDMEPITSEMALLTARLSNLGLLLLPNLDLAALIPAKQDEPDSLGAARYTLRAFAMQGIARDASAMAEQATAEEIQQVQQAIASAISAIEQSPLPTQEWPKMTELLGEELLGTLVGTSSSSLHRYRARERSTPDTIAERLHAITLITADLAGSYNDFGIRRWFTRPRAQLEGRAPIEIMKGEWTPEDEDFQKVKRLAAALTMPMSA